VASKYREKVQARSTCPYMKKLVFDTRADARRGAEVIEEQIKARGAIYQRLYPYLCPEGDHWHLSHYPQGYRPCPICHERVRAWNGGKVWVVSAHTTPEGEPCKGEGMHACTT